MGSTIPSLDLIRPYEITAVYTHPEAKVDIVLVHGLNGSPRHTWTAPNRVFWPTQLLPDTLKSAKARILVYGYNASVYAFGDKSASSDMIHQHAQTLVQNLALERKSEEVSENPIIWVVHSLGGILVKRALEFSNDVQSKSAEDSRSIFISTYGIIFLGTPHTGADPAKWGGILESMAHALIPKKAMETESVLVKTLKTNNETLQNINVHFLDIYQRFKIHMVHENVKTDLKGTKTLIVDQLSAGPLLPDVTYYGIEATHSGMCKFESKFAPGYLNISTTIKSWALESPEVIQSRWNIERKTRKQIAEAQARELLKIYDVSLKPAKYLQLLTSQPTPPASSNATTPDLSNSGISTVFESVPNLEHRESSSVDDSPLFIKPPGFRPNSLFVGRRDELAEVHKMLFNERRRSEGTSAVLLQCLPGGGKTHLARQYVYEHKEDFPGGIFWLQAKSLEQLAAGYWDIARKAALKTSSHEDVKSSEDPQGFIKLVRKWLNHRHDWLMILDGIHFNRDSDGLRQFIPDSTSTCLIYTSTEKSVGGDFHFMNPQVLRLPPLSARMAQRLLLLELNKKEPFSQDELRYSMDLVQAMQFLPLVIHAIAQRLKMTDEPLGRFARTYAAGPRLRDLGAYNSVVEQLKLLGCHEALNLIHILCFFSQQIPVEMIVLGLNALHNDVPVKAIDSVTGRSLNNTFTMLNMFALVDRNDHNASLQSSQASQNSARSRDMLADNVDVVRIHSVVQDFFVDKLRSQGHAVLSMWLERAVRVFRCSYDTATDRISRKNHAGLVEDYRLYEIHGVKLKEHVTRRERHERKVQIESHNMVECRLRLHEAHEMLDSRLNHIRSEIERRTPESSSVIAGGRPDAFQTSIFDRTSSSSDTGPETPGGKDKDFERAATWESGYDGPQLDSPTSIHYPHAEVLRRVENLPHDQFPSLPKDDTGYDSDREGSTTMTLQPAQRTTNQSPPRQSPTNGSGWQTVNYRRKRPKPARLDLHRTIKTMENKRYRDSAGAFRSITAIDPRVSRETAQGYLQRTGSSRTPSRGRLTGRSSAEAVLASISKASPPPRRGGGKIQDRGSSSSRTSDRNRVVAGAPSYADAVARPTKDTAMRQPVRLLTSPQEDSNDSPTSDGSISAMASLQRLPHARTPSSPRVQMPPYPQTPGSEYSQRPYPISPGSPFQIPDGAVDNDENGGFHLDPSANIYPRRSGPIPFETIPSTTTQPGLLPPSVSSLPKKRDLPHDYKAWHSQAYDNHPQTFTLPMNRSNTANTHTSLPSSFYVPNPHDSDPSPIHPEGPSLSLSSPNILGYRAYPSTGIYYPGRPEYSGSNSSSDYIRPNQDANRHYYSTEYDYPMQPHHGYTSQPMSRNVSGDGLPHAGPAGFMNEMSAADAPYTGRPRRPSIAVTEPPPQLPTFSPYIGPTSYDIYEDRARRQDLNGALDWEATQAIPPRGRDMSFDRARGTLRKSPRLDYASPARVVIREHSPLARVEHVEQGRSSTTQGFNNRTSQFDHTQPQSKSTIDLKRMNPQAIAFTPAFTTAPSSFAASWPNSSPKPNLSAHAPPFYPSPTPSYNLTPSQHSSSPALTWSSPATTPRIPFPPHPSAASNISPAQFQGPFPPPGHPASSTPFPSMTYQNQNFADELQPQDPNLMMTPRSDNMGYTQEGVGSSRKGLENGRMGNGNGNWNGKEGGRRGGREMGNGDGEEMGRPGSGGVRIGGRVVEFGDLMREGSGNTKMEEVGLGIDIDRE